MRYDRYSKKKKKSVVMNMSKDRKDLEDTNYSQIYRKHNI